MNTYTYRGETKQARLLPFKGYGLRKGQFYVRVINRRGIMRYLTNRDGWTQRRWDILAAFSSAQDAADYVHKRNPHGDVEIVENLG